MRGFWQFSKGALGVFGENMLVPCEVVFESRIFESQVFESAVFESQGSKREMQEEKAQVKQLVPVVQIVQIEQMHPQILDLIRTLHSGCEAISKEMLERSPATCMKVKLGLCAMFITFPMSLKLIISNTNRVKALEFIFEFTLCLVS